MLTKTITFEPVIYDMCFKYLFGYQKNIRFSEYLIETLLNKEEGYFHDKLEIMNSYKFEKTGINERGLEADIKIKLPDNSIIILEAYTNFSNDKKYKSLMYIGHTFSTQLKIGKKINQAKSCIQYNFVKGLNYNYKTFSLYSKEKPRVGFIPNMFKIYVIGIEKNSEIPYNNNIRLKGICRLLSAKNEEELKKVVEDEGKEILKEMAKELDEFYQDRWREQFFDKFNMIECEHEIELEKAIKKTRKETKKEAKQETLLKTAKNMLLENIPISSIIKITGLPESAILNLK